MPYSEAAVATLKREIERKKNHRVKLGEKCIELDKEIAQMEQDVKENDPSPKLPIDSKPGASGPGISETDDVTGKKLGQKKAA